METEAEAADADAKEAPKRRWRRVFISLFVVAALGFGAAWAWLDLTSEGRFFQLSLLARYTDGEQRLRAFVMLLDEAPASYPTIGQLLDEASDELETPETLSDPGKAVFWHLSKRPENSIEAIEAGLACRGRGRAAFLHGVAKAWSVPFSYQRDTGARFREHLPRLSKELQQAIPDDSPLALTRQLLVNAFEGFGAPQ